MIRFTLGLMLAAAGCACAWAGEPGETASAGASSNQPAALEPPSGGEGWSISSPGAANVGTEVAPTSPPEAAAQTAETEPAGADGPETGPTQAGSLTGSDRPSRSSAVRDSAGGWLRSKSVPWYRSGLVSLAVVLAAIAGVSLLLRRLVPSVRAMNGGAIEVLGRNHLAPKQSLTLVRVGRRIVLVGVTPERLSTLCVIDDPEEVAELVGSAAGERASSEASGFDRALGQAAGDFDDPEAQVEELTRGPSPGLGQAKGQLQGLLARLKSLQADASSS
jgi:flagellar biosynthetic protein FliO